MEKKILICVADVIIFNKFRLLAVKINKYSDILNYGYKALNQRPNEYLPCHNAV